MVVGMRIKRIRLSRGMSKEMVSKEIVSLTHYTNIENGRYNASVTILECLADRLGVPPEYFVQTYSKNEMLDIQKSIVDKLEQCINDENLTEAASLLNENKELLEFISDIDLELKYFLNYFQFLSRQGQRDIAIDFYEKNLLIYINQVNLVSDSIQLKYLKLLATYYYLNYQFKESLQIYSELESQYNIKHIDKVGTTYNKVLCCYKLYNLEHALFLLDEVISKYLLSHFWVKVIDCYNLKGLIYLEMNNFNESEKYLKKALSLGKSLNIDNRIWETRILHNQAELLLKQKNYEEALKIINECILLKNKIKPFDVNNSYFLRVEIFLEKEYLMEVIAFFKEIHPTTQIEKGMYSYIDARIKYQMGDMKKYEMLIVKAINCFKMYKMNDYYKKATTHYLQYLEENKYYKKALYILKEMMISFNNFPI